MKEIFPFFFANANIIEGAEAHSPGHTPWVKVSQIAMRPVRAKALIINAFALAGRFVIFNSYTQGAALGYVLIGLSAHIIDFCTPSYIRDGVG